MLRFVWDICCRVYEAKNLVFVVCKHGICFKFRLDDFPNGEV